MLSCTFAWPLFKANKTNGKSNGWLVYLILLVQNDDLPEKGI
jgi:hypothetical protein